MGLGCKNTKRLYMPQQPSAGLSRLVDKEEQGCRLLKGDHVNALSCNKNSGFQQCGERNQTVPQILVPRMQRSH